MTRQNPCTGLSDILELLSAQGLEGMASALQKLLNETMKLEREVFLNADAYERTPERRGYANGFKPKTVQSRVGYYVACPIARARVGFQCVRRQRRRHVLHSTIQGVHLRGDRVELGGQRIRS